MQSLFKLLLSLLMLCYTRSMLGVVLGEEPPTFATLKCIYNTGYVYAVSYVVSGSTGINDTIADTLVMVKNSQMISEIVFVPCRGRSAQL